MPQRYAVLLAVVGCLAASGLAGCGSRSSSSSSPAATSASGATTSTAPIEHATAKFVLHVGLAGFAFHHWIYNPFKAGLLHPLSHPVVTAKAALAAVFVYHELKLAVADAKSSKILSALFAPVVALADKVKALGSSLTGGATDAAAINAVQAGGGQIVQAAGAKGIQIPDIPVATPSG
jgi:hypothetical protein